MDNTPFMVFWKTINEILKSRDQTEMLFGEARDWWRDYQSAQQVTLPKAA